MGSCFSTGYRDNPSDKKLCPNAVAPPPPPPEEETVKEVLSETPKSKKPQIPRLERECSKRVTREDEKSDVNCKMPPAQPMPMADDDVSDVSGFSQSQSASTLTAATPEKGELLRRSPPMLRGGEFNGEMKSPPKFRNNVFSDDVKERNMTVYKSPSRRFEPSPARRSEPSPGRGRQNVGQRRDAGEISGRRSNSPAATRMVENGCGRAVLGRSLSGRKTGPSAGRVRSDQSGRIRKVGDGSDREEKWPTTMQPPPSKESLENPLVSLECFIFL